MIRVCDKCNIEVKEEEGKYWRTGHYLCKVCFKEWENRQTIKVEKKKKQTFF